MARTDKKNRECICCGKILATSQKLRQHYASIKNQCHLPIISSQSVIAPTLQVKGQGGAPVIHVRERDRRSEKLKEVILTPETSSRKDGTSTQAYREGKPSKVERQDA